MKKRGHGLKWVQAHMPEINYHLVTRYIWKQILTTYVVQIINRDANGITIKFKARVAAGAVIRRMERIVEMCVPCC